MIRVIMARTVLQHMVTGEGSPADALYVRGGSFCTFMNLFSVDRWVGYTDVAEVDAEVETDGPATIRLIRFSDGSNEVLSVTESDGRAVIPVPMGHGMVGLEVDGTFVSGCFSTPSPPSRTCSLALNVCTYDRRDFVDRKVADFLAFRDSVDFRVEMFLVDNKGDLPEYPVNMIRNRNLGGSGGFARGLYEIRRNGGFTHMVLMDDDTVLDFEAVYRMWSLCSMLKPGFTDCMVGGAMLDSRHPAMLYEAGVSGDMVRFGRGLDLSTPEGCTGFDSLGPSVANGWWLCCTPFLSESDYPAPFFMGYDDVDYGLLHGSGVITLNGISAWHDPPDVKYDPRRLAYYDVRNLLASRAMRGSLDPGLIRGIYHDCVVDALCMRTVNAELTYRALGDFLSMGFLDVDPETLHSSLPTITDCGCDAPLGDEVRRSKSWTMITLNGMLLPSRGGVLVPARTMSVSPVYRASHVVHYDEGSGRRFRQDRDPWRTLRLLFGMTFRTARCLISGRRLCSRYSEVSERVHSEDFWRERFRSETHDSGCL